MAAELLCLNSCRTTYRLSVQYPITFFLLIFIHFVCRNSINNFSPPFKLNIALR